MTLSPTMTQSLQIINARVTFRDAPIHLLEKFAFIDIDCAYKKFLENCSISECVIIQTCNRVEVFAAWYSSPMKENYSKYGDQ